MKLNLKNASLILLLLLFYARINGQVIQFTYDISGNRTTRQIDLQESKSQYVKPIKITEVDPGKTTKPEIFLSEENVVPTVFPNPTSGNLKIVNIPNSRGLSSRLQLFDMTGRLIVTQELTTSFYELDLSRFTNGVYILQLCTGQQLYSWKVIKNDKLKLEE